MFMSYEEIEIKLLVNDLAALRQRLLAAGATLHIPRTYEDNWCFDTPDHRLQQQDCLLRLRRDQRTRLTFKEPSAATDTAYKVRHEYEIEVSDFTQAQALVEKLGFAPVLRYEKYRETFRYQEAEILLDDTPLGAVVEIEGRRDVIERLTTRLELGDAPRLTCSYGEMFEAVRTAYALDFRDMTFDNFKGIDIDLRTCNLA
jgi:adenylate cyclase class 2